MIEIQHQVVDSQRLGGPFAGFLLREKGSERCLRDTPWREAHGRLAVWYRRSIRESPARRLQKPKWP